MVRTLEKNLDVDASVHCPIFGFEIDESYCYEINSVAFGLCTPDLIDNATDRITAKNTCSVCKNRQL